MNLLWIVLIVAGVVLLAFIVLYNSMVSKKNQVEYAFAGIDTMLKKRHDLIPNLVATAKQYMQHERETLTEVTEMRAKAMSGGLSDNEKVDLENKITRTLGGIMVAVENYPELKANENFRDLQRSLNEVEEQLSASRRAYNAAVTDYNNGVEMFPTNFVASMMGYKMRRLFEIPEEERKNVDVGAMFKS